MVHDGDPHVSPMENPRLSHEIPWNSHRLSIDGWFFRSSPPFLVDVPIFSCDFSWGCHSQVWTWARTCPKDLGLESARAMPQERGLPRGAEPSNKTWDKSGSLWHWSSKTWDWTDWSKTWGFHQPTIAEFNNRQEADGPQLRAWPFISLHSKGWKFAWKDVIVGQGCHFLGVPRFLTFPETRKPMRFQKSQVSWAGVFIGLTSAIIRHIGWKNGCSFAPHYRHYRQWAIPI